jgi:signal transduction histidine kinase
MRPYLGDILLEKGYLRAEDLDRALAFQATRVLGSGKAGDWVSSFLIDIARTKYNKRDEFYLGRILTELKLVPEERLREALEIQSRSPDRRPQGKLDALAQIAGRINGSYNLIDLLNLILVSTAELVEAESASLIVHDHERDALVILIPTGPAAEAVRDLEIPRGRGIASWVYAHGEPVVSNDATEDERFYPGIDEATGYTSRQILCVPLTVKGRRLGAIEAINRRDGRPFADADRLLLEMFSAQAGIAIENTRLALALAQAADEMELQKANVSTIERVRAAALVAGAFLAEVRRAVVPLQGYARRLREEGVDERLLRYSTYMDGEMDRLVRHAEDVVQYLRDDYAPVAGPVDLAELAREFESRTWVDCRVSGVALELSVEAGLSVEGDRELLLKCLSHLFRNSRDFMSEDGAAAPWRGSESQGDSRERRPGGGAAARPGGGRFSVSATRSGEEAVLSVKDTGPGIGPDMLDRIFEPFYTFGKRGGMGLGLAIVRRIVERHGGTIKALPSDTGASFEIRLPAR